jgi:hypothetical protein
LNVFVYSTMSVPPLLVFGRTVRGEKAHELTWNDKGPGILRHPLNLDLSCG